MTLSQCRLVPHVCTMHISHSSNENVTFLGVGQAERVHRYAGILERGMTIMVYLIRCSRRKGEDNGQRLPGTFWNAVE